MKPVWWIADNLISPVGLTTTENMNAILQSQSGISFDPALDAYVSRMVNDAELLLAGYTRFESLAIQCVSRALALTKIDPEHPRVGFILSTTKGNIDQINTPVDQQSALSLAQTAKRIADYFKMNTQGQTPPVVISNACISGLIALITAKRLIHSSTFDHVIVCACDLVSPFVFEGFKSLNALDVKPCHPFDKERSGITLGEAVGCVVLSKDKPMNRTAICLRGEGITNDANHISGPSRTGEELAGAVRTAMKKSGITEEQIGFISAHGTGTLYNDEMESKAFKLAGLDSRPIHSLKGYFGHTLGAAGLIESIVSKESLLRNILVPSMGFENTGTSVELNIIRQAKPHGKSACLKTASGFGGCNAAVVLEKS